MMSERMRSYALVFVVAIVSWGLLSLSTQDDDAFQDAQVSHIEYFSNGYTKKEMDAQGVVRSELVAVRMEHRSDDDTTHLEEPFLTLHNASPSPWLINSQTGTLAANGEDLFLGGKVVIQRKAAQGVNPLLINTSELQVHLPTHYAETREWTEIIANPNRTVGVGMQVTFVEPIHLKLLAKVKGRYELN